MRKVKKQDKNVLKFVKKRILCTFFCPMDHVLLLETRAADGMARFGPAAGQFGQEGSKGRVLEVKVIKK